jgi:hypothetical protein
VVVPEVSPSSHPAPRCPSPCSTLGPSSSVLHPLSVLSPIPGLPSCGHRPHLSVSRVLAFTLRMHTPTQACQLSRCELLIHHGGGGTFGAGLRCLCLPPSFLLLPHSHYRDGWLLAHCYLPCLPACLSACLPACLACLACLPGLTALVHRLRAGKPTIVCPCMADQPFWGRTAHQLGIGPKPIAFKVRSAYSRRRFLLCLPFLCDPASAPATGNALDILTYWPVAGLDVGCIS